MQGTLRILRAASSPSPQAEDVLWSRIAHRITVPAVVPALVAHLAPDTNASSRLWQKILQRIASPGMSSIFADVRHALGESSAYAPSFTTRFVAHRRSPFQWVKWAAACAVVALVIKSSPHLFFASSSIADSTVLLLPTRGEVQVRKGEEEWVTVRSEFVLNSPMYIRTQEGEATVVLHDDGVLRLGPATELFLRDILDRPQSVGAPTVLLDHGLLWVQSLVPRTLGAIVVSTPFGDVRMYEGSVSIDRQQTITNVAVWNRSASVDRGEGTMTIQAGDQVQLWSKNIPSAYRIPAREYLEPWALQNLDRDAVHRREVAELQRARRVSLAGILPTSPLYHVKRAAETVDVFLTFDDTERTRKKLSYAESRLNEAAALLTEGKDATRPLGEYKEALLAVASGSGGEVASLLHKRVNENAADLAAVLPDDEVYVLKQAVLLAQGGDVQEAFLLDSLTLLRDFATDDPLRARSVLDGVRTYLTYLQPGARSLSLPVRTDALSLLSQVVLLLSVDPERTPEEQALLNDLLTYTPAPLRSSYTLLSDEEIAKISAEIHARVFATYKMPKSRLNQLTMEMKNFHGHPDEGRILRQVYRDFPEGSDLTLYVRSMMQNLRVQRIGDRSDLRL